MSALEKCDECGAVLLDGGEVVGRHLFDCSLRRKVVALKPKLRAQAELEAKLDALAGQDVRPIPADELRGLLMAKVKAGGPDALSRLESLLGVKPAPLSAEVTAQNSKKPQRARPAKKPSKASARVKAAPAVKAEEVEAQVMVAFRFAPSLLKRLDAHAARLELEQPGSTWSRTNVVRLFLLRGLSEAERE